MSVAAVLYGACPPQNPSPSLYILGLHSPTLDAHPPEMLLHVSFPSFSWLSLPPLNPTSPVPRGIIESYSTLPWVTWWVYPEGGCYGTRWLTGLWSTQAKVESVVLRAAWHWGTDSSVVNNRLEEPSRTALYVGLPSAWASVVGDLMFFPTCRRAPFWGLLQTYLLVQSPS